MTDALTTVVIAREHDVVLARQRARQVDPPARLRRSGPGTSRHGNLRAGAQRARVRGRRQGRVLDLGRRDRRARHLCQRRGKRDRGSRRASCLVATSRQRAWGWASRRAPADGHLRDPDGRRCRDNGHRHQEPRPGRTVSDADRTAIAAALTSEIVAGPFGELQLQNQELIQALAELQRRREELAELNRELKETNRGVVALYAELDERAEELRRTQRDEVCSSSRA